MHGRCQEGGRRSASAGAHPEGQARYAWHHRAHDHPAEKARIDASGLLPLGAYASTPSSTENISVRHDMRASQPPTCSGLHHRPARAQHNGCHDGAAVLSCLAESRDAHACDYPELLCKVPREQVSNPQTCDELPCKVTGLEEQVSAAASTDLPWQARRRLGAKSKSAPRTKPLRSCEVKAFDLHGA